MNKQQAINLLKNLEQSLDDYCELNDEGKTAFRMAITALNCSEFPNSSDTISRQAAIDAIDAILPVEPMKNEYTQGITCGAALAIEYVKQLPSVQPEQKWIPVTESTLPEKGMVVIAKGERGTWDFGTYRGHGDDIHFWHWKKNAFKRVYWWMYKDNALPEPYREDEEN